jgi:hypothetical protein
MSRTAEQLMISHLARICFEYDITVILVRYVKVGAVLYIAIFQPNLNDTEVLLRADGYTVDDAGMLIEVRLEQGFVHEVLEQMFAEHVNLLFQYLD